MPSPLRELLILRHAKSDHSDPSLADFDRPLSERGREDALKMGAWILHQQLTPDYVLSSPARRTMQTLRRVSTHFNEESNVSCVTDERIYEADLTTLLSVLGQAPESKRLLLIGHNPGLESLLTYLTSESLTDTQIKLFPTCALAHFVLPTNWQNLEAGCGKLINLWHVKTLPE